MRRLHHADRLRGAAISIAGDHYPLNGRIPQPLARWGELCGTFARTDHHGPPLGPRGQMGGPQRLGVCRRDSGLKQNCQKGAI